MSTISSPPDALSVREFLGMAPTDQPTRWTLPVTRALVSGLGTLWGGCGLAVAVEAMEGATGRSCVWAAVQYIRPIHAGTVLDIEVDVERAGSRLTQAAILGTVAGERALVGLGSLVGRFGNDPPVPVESQWAEPPDVPAPEDCPNRSLPHRLDFSGTLLARIEQRWAQPKPEYRSDGVHGTGRSVVWARLTEPVETTGGALAVLADLAPSAISEALGVPASGVSLDNTVRVARVGHAEAGAWVLIDLTVETVVGQVAQLSVRMFDRDGRLLAVAGQSANVRSWNPPKA